MTATAGQEKNPDGMRTEPKIGVRLYASYETDGYWVVKAFNVLPGDVLTLSRATYLTLGFSAEDVRRGIPRGMKPVALNGNWALPAHVASSVEVWR